MAAVIRVLLRFSLSRVVYHAVTEGIAEYVRKQLPRKISVMSLDDDDTALSQSWHSAFHGLIVTERNLAQCAGVRRMGMPAVNLLDQRIETGLPTVHPDDRAVGDLGARHLLDCGFKTLCYIGNDSCWSVDREEGFVAAASARGIPVITPFERLDRAARLSYSEVYANPSSMRRQFVDHLPAQCGVMACDDRLAGRIVDAASQAGRPIPNDLAVIGSGNNVLECEAATVPLSSIPPDYFRIGMEAMALLDRQMKGETVGKPMIPVSPMEVVRRRSTDAAAFEDPDVAEAIRFIRERACEGIDVPDVLHHLAVTRSHLRWLFRKYVGRTPAQEIHCVRLDSAKRLLMETDRPLVWIAQQCGFCSQSHLTQQFRKAFGQPPHRFREILRGVKF